MIPYNVLNACDYNELYKNTKIFSVDQLESELMIKLPDNCSTTMLYQLVNISKSDTQEDVFIGEISREPGRLWLDIKLHLLDLSPGKHMYKLKFTNEENTYHPVVYFAYIIQDDDPITPYVYMKGRGNNPKIDPKPEPPKPTPGDVDYQIIPSEPYVHLDENSETEIYLTSLKDNQPFVERYTYTVNNPYYIQVQIIGNRVKIKGIMHGNCGLFITGEFSGQTIQVNVEVHPVDYIVTPSVTRLAVHAGATGVFEIKSTSKGEPLYEDYRLLNSNPDCFSCGCTRGIASVIGIKPGTGVITIIGKITGPNYSKDVNIVIEDQLAPIIVTSTDGVALNVDSTADVYVSTQKGSELIEETYGLAYSRSDISCEFTEDILRITGLSPSSGEIQIIGHTSGVTKTIEYIVNPT